MPEKTLSENSKYKVERFADGDLELLLSYIKNYCKADSNIVVDALTVTWNTETDRYDAVLYCVIPEDE